MNSQINDIDFKASQHEKTVERIYHTCDGRQREIAVNDGDLVFITNGLVVEGSRLGSMNCAPELGSKRIPFTLWENTVKKQPDLGSPAVFADYIDESLWRSFTVTMKDTSFLNSLQDFAGRALSTFKDSNWFMSIVLPNQSHFINQPDDISVFWEYGLFPNNEGNNDKTQSLFI